MFGGRLPSTRRDKKRQMGPEYATVTAATITSPGERRVPKITRDPAGLIDAARKISPEAATTASTRPIVLLRASMAPSRRRPTSGLSLSGRTRTRARLVLTVAENGAVRVLSTDAGATADAETPTTEPRIEPDIATQR